MIMVLDLLRNIFIIMFFILMALEIVVLVSMIFLYKTPLNENTSQIEKASKDNTYEILNSFNFLFQRKYYQIETDLLLIAKHLHSMHLTLNNIDEAFPTFQATSLFVKSYKNCIANNDFSKDANFVKNSSKYNYSSPFSNYNITDEVFSPNELKTFYNLNEEQIVKAYMAHKAPNYISFISPTSTITSGDFKGFAWDTYLCYSISILKSMYIRDAIFERKNPLVDRYLIFFQDKYIFQYPIDLISNAKVQYLRFYNITDPDCTTTYGGQKCFTTFRNMNYSDYVSKIQFEKPKISHSGYGKINIFN